MARIVIIGAGLTGLSAAYHLEKKGFFDYKIFERDGTVGGLCRSLTQDGFTFDYTGHLLHVSDPYFQSFIAQVVGVENLNTIVRRSFIYSHDVYTHYPFQINLFGLPHAVIAECIEGFVLKKKYKKCSSFYDWVLYTFGKGIAHHFFFPFQKKIFSYDLKKIDAAWTGRFVPKTSLSQMIQGALQGPEPEEKIGYNAQFYYPREGGIYFWIDKLAKTLQNPILTNYDVSCVDLKTKTILFRNGDHEPFDIVISTMPLNSLLHRLDEKSTTSYGKHAGNLLCNSVVNFNLGINRHDLSDKHWIYFPEQKFPFYRLGFPHNFASTLAPEGCSSLYGEFSYINSSSRGCMQRLKNALRITKKLLNIDQKDIMTEKIINISHAYVIYDFWREKYLTTLLRSLQHDDIYSIGRYGAWKYSSMQEAVFDGKKIAEELLIMPAQETFFIASQHDRVIHKELT